MLLCKLKCHGGPAPHLMEHIKLKKSALACAKEYSKLEGINIINIGFEILSIQIRTRLKNIQPKTASFGNSWQVLAILGNSWQFLAILRDSWLFLAIFGNSWQFLTVLGNS